MTNSKKQITDETKKAWANNWKEHSVENVLEIFNYTRVKRLLEIFLSLLPKDGKILEGGCGLGPWTIKLHELGYDITGVDYDDVSVAKLREYAPEIPLYVSAIEKMPFEDNTFSAYMSLGVIEHFVEGPQEAIKEACRVLKPGGCFLVMVPYMNFLFRIKYPFLRLKRNKILRKLLGKKDRDFYFERYFKKKELKRLLEEGGFSVEKIFPADHIFSFVAFSGVFRDKNTYDGENELAVKCADILSRIFPWQTAGSCMVVARKI